MGGDREIICSAHYYQSVWQRLCPHRAALDLKTEAALLERLLFCNNITIFISPPCNKCFISEGGIPSDTPFRRHRDFLKTCSSPGSRARVIRMSWWPEGLLGALCIFSFSMPCSNTRFSKGFRFVIYLILVLLNKLWEIQDITGLPFLIKALSNKKCWRQFIDDTDSHRFHVRQWTSIVATNKISIIMMQALKVDSFECRYCTKRLGSSV